ncbi:MAG: hypothetical protein K6G08_04470 [Prevotella sp.]|nr:hypothetical protein [Prevotella sp.]
MIIQNIANNYNLTQNIQNERDLTKSRKKWIENNSHDKRWLQYGYSLFIYCPYGRNTQRRLRARWNYGDINSEYIGFYDKKIETRDQLLKVDYEIGELRKGICKRISRLSWGIIYSIIGLVSFGIVYSICQVLPPVFKEIDGIWAVILLFMLFCAIAVGLWQFLDLVIVPHVEYIRDCYRIRRWITENPTDWRKEYILFINYSDYKTWREL